MGVGVNCQGIAGNTEECQGNVLDWKQSARGMHGNAGESKGIPGNPRGTYGSGCKVSGECWGIQGNSRGMYGSGCKLPG